MLRSPLALAVVVALAAVPPALAGPREVVDAIHADAKKLTPDAARRTRYLARPPWVAVEQWADLWRPKLLKAWANGLSREVDFASPRAVGDEAVAVVLDDYKWNPAVWEKQRIEPYFHRWRWKWYEAGPGYAAGWYRLYRYPHWMDRDKVCDLERWTGSKVSVVRADWWLFYSSRQIDLDSKEQGFGYADWLGLAKRADFEALRAVDKKTSIRLGLEIRAAIEEGESGVAQKDRLIEWYATYGDGDYWLTLDTDDTSHGNTAPANLKPGQFKHKAEEGYISLPNDMWAFWLGTDKGARQATAPDFIGPNDSPLRQGRDGRIHLGASCLHCHTDGGLKSIDDWFRRTIRPPLGLAERDYAEYQRTKRQYASDLDGRLERGRARYAAALKRCAGLTPVEYAKLHADAYYGYGLRRRTRADVAAELGVTEDCLGNALKAYAKSNGGELPQEHATLAPLLREPPGTLPVKYVEDGYGVLQDIIRDHKP